MKRKGLTLLLLGSITILPLIPTHIVHASTFDSSRIIDDAVFDNVGSMAATQIDSFLNQYPNSCISTNNGFLAPDPTGYNPTNGFLYGGNVSAGQVIYDASLAYGLNPQVIISTLQKEEGLVDGSGPYGCSALALSAAAGYGCPDAKNPDGSIITYSYSNVDLYTSHGTTVTSISGTCVNSALKVGFSQQIIHAVWLLKFGEQRSEGNINWAVIKGNWDNSDDPQSCYSGPMTEGTWQICPSGASTYYDGYTTIDGTSVHMDDGSTAALYWYTPHFSGNQNFFNIFSNWFGDTTLAYAFTSSTDPTIYLYIDGYKIAVSAMGVLQDYGFNSNSIRTLSQQFIDSIPTPPSTSGVSPNISYIVKSPSDTDADGGSIYLISVGKRYAFTSMQQFNDFGFNTSNIAYLPLSYIISIPNGGFLSNYIHAPNGQVFQVAGGAKRVIFDYSTFISADPSGVATDVSYFDANLVTSGNPLANNPILVKTQGSEAVYLYTANTYYSVPDFNTYSCWGFDTSLNVPVYRVADNSYISPITPASSLSCLIRNASGSTELLARKTRYPVPSSFGLSGTNADPNVLNLETQIPLSANQLKQYIQPSSDHTVWYLTNGNREQVPTYSDFSLLNLTTSQIDTIDSSAVNAIPSNGIKLGQGQAVRSDNSTAVYGIFGSSRILYSRSDDFTAYHNAWSSIEVYPSATLDALYPYQSVNINPYFYSQANDNVYLVDPNGCYLLDPNMLSGYGQSLTTIKTSQTYDGSLFPQFSTTECAQGSYYVKQAGQSLVYWIDSGEKHPIYTYAKLVSQSGESNPYVITMSNANINSFPTGASL